MKITCALFLLGCLCHPILSEFNREYWYVYEKLDWHDAHLGCRIINMRLATIPDETANEEIRGIIIKDKDGFWTSGTNLMTNRKEYKWTGNGLPLTYTNWKEPPSGDGNKCIAYLDTGYWIDAACSDLKPYICELNQ